MALPVSRFPTFRTEIPAFLAPLVVFPSRPAKKRLWESHSFPWEAPSERGKFGEFLLGMGMRPKPGEIPEFVPFWRAVSGLGSCFN